MESISSIFQGIEPEKKRVFAEKFFSVWCENGFGSFTKKDTELLIFSCLENLLDSSRPTNNYEWSKVLKIPPAKVKSLRLEAYLKFNSLFTEEEDRALLERCFSNIESFQLSETDPTLERGEVRFVVEDPVILMVLDRKLKDLGSFLDYERNREIVKITLKDFLVLVNGIAKLKEDDVIWRLAEVATSDATKMQKVKDKMKNVEYKTMSEQEKLVHFVEFLGDTFAEKPTKLIKYMTSIIKSQAYKPKLG